MAQSVEEKTCLTISKLSTPTEGAECRASRISWRKSLRLYGTKGENVHWPLSHMSEISWSSEEDDTHA